MVQLEISEKARDSWMTEAGGLRKERDAWKDQASGLGRQVRRMQRPREGTHSKGSRAESGCGINPL